MRNDRHGARVNCRETGSGETVVMLHSSASSGSQWRALMGTLRGRWHVVSPDLYGYGETDAWPGTRQFSLSQEAALIDAVLPSDGHPVHLVGHSYGGAVALRFAMQQPHRVRSLVLIEPVAFHLLWDTAPAEENRALFREVRTIASAVSRAATRGDYRSAMARFIDYWNGKGAWSRLQPPLQAELARRIPKIALDFWAAMTEASSAADYRGIGAPTLVLCGSRSPAPAQRIAEIVAASLSRSRLQTIEGAGHMLPLTHPEIVNAAIATHLFRCRSESHPAAA